MAYGLWRNRRAGLAGGGGVEMRLSNLLKKRQSGWL